MIPGYWKNETSGVLRPAVMAYLHFYLDGVDTMTPEDIAAIRAYLRQWIAAPGFNGAGVDQLRTDIEGLTSRAAITRWLDTAADLGIDPL